MECPVCMEQLDARARRPKALPCGHMACLTCLSELQQLKCPECRKDFPGLAADLADNIPLLRLLDEVRPNNTRVWCLECLDELKKSCIVASHKVCPEEVVPALRLQRVQPQVQQVQKAAGTTRQVLQLLERLDQRLHDQLRETREQLQRLEEAERRLGAAAAGEGSVEAAQRGADEQLQQVGQLGQLVWGARARLKDSVEECTSQLDICSQDLPGASIPELKVSSITQALTGEKTDEKAALLRRVRQEGVRRLSSVYCNSDPAWSLELMKAAAPLLEELVLYNSSRKHLLAVQAMPRLTRLYVSSNNTDLGELPALQHHGGLQWLCVQGLPRDTTCSLLRTHRHSLRELYLEVGTAGDKDWPYNCNDLPSLLAGCRQLTTLVLWRYCSEHTNCREQLDAVRAVLPGVTVQCSHCDKVVFNF